MAQINEYFTLIFIMLAHNIDAVDLAYDNSDEDEPLTLTNRDEGNNKGEKNLNIKSIKEKEKRFTLKKSLFPKIYNNFLTKDE